MNWCAIWPIKRSLTTLLGSSLAESGANLWDILCHLSRLFALFKVNIGTCKLQAAQRLSFVHSFGIRSGLLDKVHSILYRALKNLHGFVGICLASITWRRNLRSHQISSSERPALTSNRNCSWQTDPHQLQLVDSGASKSTTRTAFKSALNMLHLRRSEVSNYTFSDW